MGNCWQGECYLRHRIDGDTAFGSDGFAQLVCDGSRQRIAAFFLEQHRTAGEIQLSGEGFVYISGSPVFLKEPHHRIDAKVFSGKLHRHGCVGVGRFRQREVSRHHRVNADCLLMGYHGATAVFCCGNEGDAACLREFHLAAVCGQRTVCQIGKLGWKSVSES